MEPVAHARFHSEKERDPATIATETENFKHSPKRIEP